MRILRKSIEFFDKVFETILFLVCVLLVIISLYLMYDNYVIYKNASDNSLLQYRPDYKGEGVKRELCGDMVGWISLDNTYVNYPIMQGDTNTEFLNKDPYGEYSLSGSIFMDSRNNTDWSDPYVLIYGHHMAGEMMFGCLDFYLDENYFNQHQSGTIFIGNKLYDLRIFAVLETEATNEKIFSPTEVSVNDTWSFVKDNAKYLDIKGIERMEESLLVALSTCKYPDTAERTVVLGVIQ